MSSDLVSASITLFLAAIKLAMLSGMDAVPAIHCLFVALWSFVLYVSMCPISEAISGKEYLRNWTKSRSWEPDKYSKTQDKFYYYFNMIVAVMLAIFSLVMLFSVG